MDFGRAFTYLTEDENWIVKVAIGAGISFFAWLIFPLFLLIGYMVAITRNVMNGQDVPLPEWFDDIGGLFRDGIFVWIAQMVYTLPFWLLTCIGTIAIIGFTFLGESSPDLAAGGILVTYAVIGCLALIFMVALFFISPAVVIQYVRTNELGACFRFGEVLGIARDNVGPIIMTMLALMAITIVISLVSGLLQIIPCIGTIIGLLISIMLGPYIIMATGHLYGQIARNVDSKPAGAY